MSKVPKSRTAPARNGKVVRVAQPRKGKTKPLSAREARRQAVDLATKMFVDLHREALKELERY